MGTNRRLDLRIYTAENKVGLPHAGTAADGSITPLHCAVWHEDEAMARSILAGKDTKIFLKAYTSGGSSEGLLEEQPVHYAARKGSFQMLHLLSEAGADLMARTQRGGTPYGPAVLHFAVASGYPNAVQAVLDRLPGPKEVEKAMYAGDGQPWEEVEAYLEAHPEDPRETKEIFDSYPQMYGRTALQWAVTMYLTDERPSWLGKHLQRDPRNVDRREVIARLLAVPGVSTDSGYGYPYALWVAVEKNDEELVKSLLEGGANPLIAFWAENGLQKDSVTISEQEDLCPLSLALRLGKKNMVRLLLEHSNFELALENHGSISPLYEAVSQGESEFVAAMVEKGANPFAQESPDAWVGGGILGGRGESPQERQERERHIKGAHTWSPLIMAAEKGYTKVAETLIAGIRRWVETAETRLKEMEALLESIDYQKEKRKYQKVGERCLLLRQYSDPALRQAGSVYGIDYADREDGITALHAAVRNGHAGTVAVLLRAGASVDKQTMALPLGGGGETPLHIALKPLQNERPRGKKNLIHVVQLLLQAGADVMQPDASGVTPRKMAERLPAGVREELERNNCRALLE